MTPHAGVSHVSVRMFSAQPSGSHRASSHPRHHPYRCAAPQPRSRAPRGARSPGLGRGQGQCLWARHRARVRRLPRRRRLRAARPGRGRTRARARLARPGAAAGRRVRAARSRALLAARPLAHGALRRADRHAGRPQDAGAAARLPEDEFGHEPAGLRARALPLGVDAPERAAAGRRDLADDALQRRRRQPRHRPPAGGVRARHARPAGRALDRQQRGHAAPCGRDAGRLDAPRHPALRQRARFSRARCGALATAARDDAFDAADLRADPEGRRHHRLRLALHRRRAARRRRGRGRLCRRLSAPLRYRHAGAGERRAHAHGGPRQHGHDHRRPHAGARRRHRQRGHAVGPGVATARCSASTRSRRPPARSATS